MSKENRYAPNPPCGNEGRREAGNEGYNSSCAKKQMNVVGKKFYMKL